MPFLARVMQCCELTWKVDMVEICLRFYQPPHHRHRDFANAARFGGVSSGPPYGAIFSFSGKRVFFHMRSFTVLHTGGTEHVRNGKSRDVARAQGAK